MITLASPKRISKPASRRRRDGTGALRRSSAGTGSVKFKLDENIGRRGQEILKTAGYDFFSVAEEHIQCIEDSNLIERCRAEARCLVTLDLGFANPLVFLPSHYAGIAVLRLPKKPSAADLIALMHTLTDAADREQIAGKLWIVEVGRIRVYQEEQSDVG
jgi:predicted nuclease of predicted toxin-antitoxin system